MLRKLDNIKEILNYYSNGGGIYNDNILEIQRFIKELALNKKEDHIRLAKKLKHVWETDKKNK